MQDSAKAKILIVDDVPANLLAVQAVLKSPQYELVEVECGLEAVRLCGLHEFAVVMLDVHMPNFDGFQTARAIKETILNRETPIIFLTATYQEEPYMKKGYEVGAVDYIGKPFDPEILKTKVGIYTDLFLKTKKLLGGARSAPVCGDLGLVVVDMGGRVCEYNTEATKIFGTLAPNFEDAFRTSCSVLRLALAEGQAAGPADFEVKTSSGHWCWISGSAHPIHRDGERVGALVVVQSATSL